MQRQPVNLPASVHQRLLNLSQQLGQEFNRLLLLYAIERLLYRLAQSPYGDRFILKGALLFMVWAVPNHRPTRDLDLLGYGESSPDALAALFAEVCGLPVAPDGLSFDPQSLRVREIREDQEYGGQRVEMTATLGKARLSLQIDIGFGDSVTPKPLQAEYPTLLEFPAPYLHMYPKESVIAEKLHAMVEHDLSNSRMKDFYDLWTLSRLFSFDGAQLAQAIQATFTRRGTPIPLTAPTALRAEFANHPDKIKQWQAFLSRNRLDIGNNSWSEIIAVLHRFLLPPLQVTADPAQFVATWTPTTGAWLDNR